MTKLIILGSGYAVANPIHENTHMVVVGREHTVLIDTASNPFVRLPQAGVDPLSLTDLVLTHFHPDHVSGVPLLLLDSWLMRRTRPLNIYGLEYTLDRVRQMMALYSWEKWPDFFPVNFYSVPEKEMTPLMNYSEFSIYASPVRHMLPNIGLRIDFHPSGRAMAYSSDTGPSEEVVRLATGVDLLIHESTGAEHGHSSAEQAGSIARQAKAARLLLIHYEPDGDHTNQLIERAQTTYPGPVELAQDFLSVEF